MDKMPWPADKVERRPIASLIPYARNSRIHSPAQVAQIAASMKEWGWTNPVLIDEDGGIIAGHGRVMAAELLKIDEVPVMVALGWSDAKKRAYIIADNKLALTAEWDEAMLSLELTELSDLGFDISLTGFSLDEIDDLMGVDGEEQKPDAEPDAIPDAPVIPHSKLGDVWLCGEHRVACCDSLDPVAIGNLLEGNKADMVFTDPPYLMDFTGAVDGKGNQRSKHDKITNDKMSKSDGDKFLRAITAMIRMQCQGAWYICFYRLGIDWMMNALTDSGLKWRNLIIWKKNHLNLSNSDYKALYEPIMYGLQNDYEPMLYGWNLDHEFEGAKGEVDVWENGVPSVWEIDRTKSNDLHPTMKPVSLVVRAIENSSKKGDVVLDLFGGSGTTLIACVMTGRKARVSELEPKYADVICKRYYDFTGKKPIHAVTGEEFPVVVDLG